MNNLNRRVVVNLRRCVWTRLLAACAVAGLACGLGAAQVTDQKTAPNPPASIQPPAQDQTDKPAAQSPSHTYFTDVELVNQNGEKMRFYSDLLQAKVVIINSFFATCPGSCLPMERNLEKMQEALGDRMGKDVHIISISVDPVVDTPANLKEYAGKLHAGPGWYFLTGQKQNVDFALKKLGQLVADKRDHLNIFIIGNERTGLWKKAFGLAKSDELVKVVESVLEDNPADDK
ncbi:MAG TPA: SCO family protein [Pyrinomonadaceae bacterium]|jgi:protein SCO1/2|nr:SCO family protein [Pyrinomonadaceae bacterium]